MSIGRRIAAVLGMVAVLGVGGAAWGYFTSHGSGTGHGSTGTMSTVTLSATAGSASTPLYPGGTGDVSLEVNNPNSLRGDAGQRDRQRDDLPRCGPLGLHDHGGDLRQPERAHDHYPGQCHELPDPPARSGLYELLVLEWLPGGNLLDSRDHHGGEVMNLFGGVRNGRPNSSRRGRVVAGIAGGTALVVLVAGLAFAYWITTDSSNPAAASATSLSAPTGATATETGATSVKISWTNPGTQVTGAQYQVVRTPGTGTLCTVSAPTSSCTDSGLSPGTAYSYSVTAVLDAWQSTAVSASFTPMAVGVTYPVNSTTYGANWTGTLTGTASAATGTTISGSGVTVSVQQGTGASSCWTGSGANFTATCPKYVTATYASGNWSLALPSGDLTSGDTYKVTAEAIDSLSVSATSSTVSFTYTVPAPIASAPVANATISYSTAPTWFDKEPVTLTDSPSVNGGTPVASVTYFYCLKSNVLCTNTSIANWTSIGTSTASGSNWTLTWASASLPPDGTYNLMATATNSSSVTSGPSSTSTQIGIDTTPPTVSTPSVNGVS